MVQSASAVGVAQGYPVPELDALLMRKWTDGGKCATAHLQLFNRAKATIAHRTKKGDWAESDQADFDAKSLARVENLMDNERPAFVKAKNVVAALRNLMILEALPESEKREELIQRVLAQVESTGIEHKRAAY